MGRVTGTGQLRERCNGTQTDGRHELNNTDFQLSKQKASQIRSGISRS